MRTKHNHTCIICGSEYTFCPNCSEYDKFPRWMNIFCSENCHDIFEVANNFSHGIIDKEAAKEVLKDIDLSKKAKYTGGVKKAINEIISEDKEVNDGNKSHNNNYQNKNYSQKNETSEKRENGFKKQYDKNNATKEKTVNNNDETIKKANDMVMSMSFSKKGN